MGYKSSFGKYLREAVFGVNDGLVSTLGLVAGVASSGASKAIVLLAGIAGVFAGAISMAAGTYLAIKSQEEYRQFKLKKTKKVRARKIIEKFFRKEEEHPFHGAILMGLSFIIGGLIPLLPHIFAIGTQALLISTVLTIFALFCFGALKTVLTKRNPLTSGLEMVFIGMIAFVAGVIIGRLFG